MAKPRYIPCTPAGSLLAHLESSSHAEAVKKLLKDAAHMPYGTWENFEKRGYTIYYDDGKDYG